MKNQQLSLLTMVIVSCIFLCCSCAPQPEVAEYDFDWVLNATQIKDGEVLKTFEFTVFGNVSYNPDDYTQPGTIYLDIVWPPTFRFVSEDAAEYTVWPSDGGENITFTAMIHSVNQSKTESVPGILGIAPEKGYMFFSWTDDETYLIASVDSSTPYEDIKSVFANMMTGERFQ